jgi:pyruvate dehydrogenase E2 component (dihydrolipoamide acetyltransferase)
MPTDIIMPQMGESIVEGTITKWLKKPGDKVQRDEPLFEISTDKVDAEIPAPASGVLQEIKVAEGTTVNVNTVVGTIAVDGEAAAKPAPAPEKPATKRKERRPKKRKLFPHRRRSQQPPLMKRTKKPAPPRSSARSPASTASVSPKSPAPDSVAASPNRTSCSSSRARDLRPGYRSLPLPLSQRPPLPRRVPQPPPLSRRSRPPMTNMRKLIAKHMIESRRTSAHVHCMYEVDFTRIVNLRAKHKSGFEQRHGARLTFMPFFVRAAVIALQQWPIINAAIEGDNIRYHRHINMGIAVALDWGLIVPVLKNAGDLNFLGLQRGITDLGERARTKKLKPDDVEGSTFTVTNPGQFGAVFGLPIINQPNSAIMGVGGITKQPMVITDKDGNDSIAIRSVVHLTLGYDHRLIDGAVADQFMAQVKKNLETWSEEVG